MSSILDILAALMPQQQSMLPQPNIGFSSVHPAAPLTQPVEQVQPQPMQQMQQPSNNFGDALSRIAAATNGADSLQKYDSGQFDLQQKQSALAAMTQAQQQGITDPMQLFAKIAQTNPSALKDYVELASKNPLAFSMASQSTTPSQGGNNAYTLAPETPDDKRDYNFLNTKVPAQYRQLVRQISNGDESVGNADSLRSNGLLAMASQFDPSLTKTDFTTRQATAKDISGGGKSGQALTSINTATKHLAQVALAGLDLHNGNNKLFNYLGNESAKWFGDEKLTNLDSVVQTVAPELAKAAAGGGDTTGEERKAQGDAFSGSASPKQILGAVAGKVDLMQSKADEIGNTYKKNIGREPKQLINPENKQTLADLKALDGYAKNDKLDTPEAKAVIQRLRAVVGQGGDTSSAKYKEGQQAKFPDGSVKTFTQGAWR